LEVDHVDPTAKAHPAAHVWAWSLERREPELAKCQVLCRACHQAKHNPPQGHGILARYRAGCRCEECREAQRLYMRCYRAARRTG
jgi:hypothetical protein